MDYFWCASQIIYNEDMYNLLRKIGDCYIDWEVTALFYSALHLTNKYFYENDLEMPQSHTARNNLLKHMVQYCLVAYKDAINDMDPKQDLKLPFAYIFNTTISKILDFLLSNNGLDYTEGELSELTAVSDLVNAMVVRSF